MWVWDPWCFLPPAAKDGTLICKRTHSWQELPCVSRLVPKGHMVGVSPRNTSLLCRQVVRLAILFKLAGKERRDLGDSSVVVWVTLPWTHTHTPNQCLSRQAFSFLFFLVPPHVLINVLFDFFFGTCFPLSLKARCCGFHTVAVTWNSCPGTCTKCKWSHGVSCVQRGRCGNNWRWWDTVIVTTRPLAPPPPTCPYKPPPQGALVCILRATLPWLTRTTGPFTPP